MRTRGVGNYPLLFQSLRYCAHNPLLQLMRIKSHWISYLDNCREQRPDNFKENWETVLREVCAGNKLAQ